MISCRIGYRRVLTKLFGYKKAVMATVPESKGVQTKRLFICTDPEKGSRDIDLIKDLFMKAFGEVSVHAHSGTVYPDIKKMPAFREKDPRALSDFPHGDLISAFVFQAAERHEHLLIVGVLEHGVSLEQ